MTDDVKWAKAVLNKYIELIKSEPQLDIKLDSISITQYIKIVLNDHDRREAEDVSKKET